MSRTIIKAIWPGERHRDYGALYNSWGSAPVIWQFMAARYLRIEKSYDYPSPGWMQSTERIWPLWKRIDIPEHQRAVLMMTFDRAYVLKKDYPRAGRHIRAFLQDLGQYEGVNHWPHIAELYESDPDVPAIGFWCTSVSEDPFLGNYNEETNDFDPPDWSRCYDLYADIGALAITIHGNREETA
jgi:hypothetical protein